MSSCLPKSILAMGVLALSSACVPGPYYGNSTSTPYGYGNSSDSYYYNRERERAEEERRELERERHRLEEERRRVEEERRRPTPTPPPPPAREQCPSGLSPSERRCSDKERQRGCRDIRLPGGLGCVSR